mgnify:FL=1
MERLVTVKNHLTSSRGMQDVDQVLKEWRGNCFKIILNRPKQYNAMGSIMHLELLKAIEEANNSAKVCILKSILAGKVFCAGGDVKGLVQLFKNNEGEPVTMQYNKLMLEMARAKPITIAFWDGIVMGGGTGLSVNCNIKIATENTAFGMPEAKLGFFSDVGAAYFLPRIKKNIGLFLAMTSYSLKGKQAYQAGVADYFVLSKNIPALEAEIEKLSLVSTVSEELIRETIEKYAEKIPKVYEGEDLIAEIFQGKDVSEVLEKLKQKSQENTTVKKWYGDILKNCPLSLFYNFESLKRGKTLNLHEALSMETYLATKVNRADFLEGVRTVLVEKGAKPNWSVTFKDLKTQKPEDYFPEKLTLVDFDGYKPSLEVNLALIKKYAIND